MSEAVYAAWEDALRHAWLLARGERLGELRGNRARTFNDSRIHPLSYEIGRIRAMEDLMPELRHADFNPMVLRREAQAAAKREYDLETAIAIGLQMGWITETQAEAMRSDDGSTSTKDRSKDKPRRRSQRDRADPEAGGGSGLLPEVRPDDRRELGADLRDVREAGGLGAAERERYQDTPQRAGDEGPGGEGG